jgi:hypothetical protein
MRRKGFEEIAKHEFSKAPEEVKAWFTKEAKHRNSLPKESRWHEPIAPPADIDDWIDSLLHRPGLWAPAFKTADDAPAGAGSGSESGD